MEASLYDERKLDQSWRKGALLHAFSARSRFMRPNVPLHSPPPPLFSSSAAVLGQVHNINGTDYYFYEYEENKKQELQVSILFGWHAAVRRGHADVVVARSGCYLEDEEEARGKRRPQKAHRVMSGQAKGKSVRHDC
eukprot:2254768-Rhodomonas_salina.1